MKKFINHEQELNFLESEYRRNGSALVIIYGRRRVGKTALANKFLDNKNGLYFLATEENEAQNRLAFQNMVAEFTGNELLKNTFVSDWELIFKALLTHKTAQKTVIVIDEFQYIGKSNPAFPSILQKIWDTLLEEQNIMLILCGSLISLIESQTLNYGSPLYGRRTGQIRLKQIPFANYHEFFPKKKYSELIEYYAVTGGIPRYIELFYEKTDIYTAIHDNILSRNCFLYDEPHFLLQKEISETGTYFSIIKSIAAGSQKLSKIATNLELKQTGLTKYLQTLINLDILKREVPVTEERPEKSKRGLYRIKDNFLLFWFRFIFPYLSYIESGHSEIVMNKIHENLINGHISYIYENICLEKMWQLNEKNTWNFNFDKAGRWWNSHTEIDIVALDHSDKNIIFGECKYWQKRLVGVEVLNELERKSAAVEWHNEQRKNHFVLFAINGFSNELMQIAQKRSDLILIP